MPEHVIGAKAHEIVRVVKHAEGSLAITHSKGDILSNTIGHITAVPFTHLPLFTPESMFKNPSRELVDQLVDRWKDVPWKGDVLVRVGNTSIIGDIQRILANDKIRAPFSFKRPDSFIGKGVDALYKGFAIYLTVMGDAMAKLTRQDHYNVLTNTVNVFHPRLAIGMHEVGHAQFFNTTKNPVLYTLFGELPIIKSFVEWKATANAMGRFKTDAERKKALKVLEPAFATYLIRDLFLLAAPFSPALASIISGYIPLLTVPNGQYVIPFMGIGSILSGHFMARGYPRQKERFAYVFEGKTPAPTVDTLQPYQRLVARAKPF